MVTYNQCINQLPTWTHAPPHVRLDPRPGPPFYDDASGSTSAPDPAVARQRTHRAGRLPQRPRLQRPVLVLVPRAGTKEDGQGVVKMVKEGCTKDGIDGADG